LGSRWAANELPADRPDASAAFVYWKVRTRLAPLIWMPLNV
jgi:hypothetical protein